MRHFKIMKASAGAGKTFNLVKEYLSICLKDAYSAQENYKHILAITFTKAASKDMRRKIIEELINIIDKPEPTDMAKTLMLDLSISQDELRQNAKILYNQFLHDYSNFCVSTIDSFNQRLSRSFASELGLPQGFNTTIDDDEISDILIENIGLEISNDKLLKNTLVKLVAQSMEEYEKKTNIRELIDYNYKLFQKEEAFEADNKTNCYEETKYQETKLFLTNKIESLEKQILDVVAKHHKDLLNIIVHFDLQNDDFYNKSKGIPLIKNALDKIVSSKPFSTKAVKDLLSLATFNSIHYGLLNGCDTKGKEYKWYSKDVKGFSPEELDNIGKQLLNVFDGLKKDISTSTIDTLDLYKTIKKDLFKYVLRSKIEQETENIISENEKVSIEEFNKRIATVLGDFSVPFIYERIGEHFHHVFIDEFQDTSLLQWQNLIPLVDNCLSGGNTCLVVGDGKQSIYHFKNAEVRQLTNLPKIFKKPNANFDIFERKFLEEHEFEVLDSNWRTSETIVKFNNDFFNYVVGRQDFNQNNKKIYVWEENGAKIDQTPQRLFNGLVQIELVKDGLSCNGEELEKDEYILRRITELIEELHRKGHKYKDIAVIINSNDNCSKTALHLSQNGIPVISSTSLLLKTSKRVLLLVNMLSYLVCDNNPTTIASILYLHNTLKGHSDIENFFSPVVNISNHENDETIEPYLGLGVGTLKEMQTQSYSLYDLCSALARLFDFDIMSDPYLNYFFDTIQNWQTSDNVGIKNFLNFWEKKKNKLAIKTSDNIDAVQITTIHKSKGLEYPIVIFPFSNGKITESAGSKWVKQSELGHSFEPVPNINKVNISLGFEQTQTLQQEEKDAEELETINRIYVAMTRPQKMLFILTKIPKDSSKLKGSNIFEGYLNDTSSQEFGFNKTENEYGASVYRLGEIDSVEVEKQKTEETHIISSSKSIDWTQSLGLEEPESPDWLHDVAPSTISPSEWGKIVHLILAEITTPEDVETAVNVTKNIDSDTIAVLKQRLNEMTAIPEIAEAFSSDATIKTECEILYKNPTDGKREILRPDRFAELHDRIILIDYKTGKEFDEHQSQIRKYADALSKLCNKSIEKYLVYLSRKAVTLKKV